MKSSTLRQNKEIDPSKTFILISAYLEGPCIRSVVEGLHTQGYRNIIVVDDGSPDRTYEEAMKAGNVYLLQHMVNRGKGAGMRTGTEAAKKLGAEVLVAFDGDGQHSPKDVKKLLEKIAEGYDVVMGTRMLDPRGMPYTKQVANIIGNIITRVLFGITVSDSQSGLRAFSKKALALIETKSDRYTYETEVLKEIVRNRLTYAEVPIEVIYTKHSQTKAVRQSFVNGIKTLIRLLMSL